MSKQNVTAYTNGTSALKMPCWENNSAETSIISFPSSRAVAKSPLHARLSEERLLPTQLPSPVKRLIDASEMACSLRFESMGGCPYNMFTKSNIAVLSTGASLIGLISLILGA